MNVWKNNKMCRILKNHLKKIQMSGKKPIYKKRKERLEKSVNVNDFFFNFYMSGKSYLIVEEKCLEKYQNVWNFSKASD